MKVGDLIRCNCVSDVWYKGKVGMLVGFNRCTKDPEILYFNNEILRLAKSSLEVISESL